MIQVYTGVPGSGKSYKMVLDLSNFLSKNPDVEVISNIRNLKLPHTDFEKFLDDLFPDQKLSEQIEKFFTYEHQQKLNEKFCGPILYVLDECQLYFPRRASMPKTEAYLQRHRHLGHYLYLATQSLKLVNSNFIPLIEIEYAAVRRSISFFGEIHYKEKSPQSRLIIRKIVVRPKKEIFNLYQSFEASEIKKPKPVLFRYLIIPLLMTPFFYLFYDKFLNVKSKAPELERPSINIDSPAPVEKDFQELERLKNQLRQLKDEIHVLNSQLEQKERVFLPVVRTESNKKLTVDPETGAVVEVASIKGRKVICINRDTTCYYDKPVASKINIPGNNSFDQSLSFNPIFNLPLVPSSNYAPSVRHNSSFITSDMVPKD